MDKESKRIINEIANSLEVGINDIPDNPPALPPKKSVTGKITLLKVRVSDLTSYIYNSVYFIPEMSFLVKF